MELNMHKTVQIGELIAAAFDEADRYSSDPREVSRLATRAVMHMLRSSLNKPLTHHLLQHAPNRETPFDEDGS